MGSFYASAADASPHIIRSHYWRPAHPDTRFKIQDPPTHPESGEANL